MTGTGRGLAALMLAFVLAFPQTAAAQAEPAAEETG
jgi:hypothetical protein